MIIFQSLVFLVGGCANPEVINDGDVEARVVIPRLAATRTVVAADDPDGDGVYAYTTRELTDPRLLGPVYVGAYGAIDNISFRYPHPSMGPIISGGIGDTFPYGGETVGRLDFACYELVSCKVTTGRFKGYADLLDHFRNNLGIPMKDGFGKEVVTPEAMRAWCYDYFSATSDEEMAFIGEDALDFTVEGDNYVADITLHHTNRIEGMSLWGFMDAPELNAIQSDVNGAFTTCGQDFGREVDEYNSEFNEGSSFFDILNHPSTYIQYEDWVADGLTIVRFDADMVQTEVPDVNFTFHYQAE
ncbi:MAG: hypothetical protein EXR71_02990 [Myxococcales bacterium]|nr:hypothetical protein [Myxococcales bacterium]